MSDAAAFWNAKFSNPEYLYGTGPNDFLREQSRWLAPASSVLSIGEGEGRNAVFLAEAGHQVTALDTAETGLRKLEQLAQARGAHVATLHADLEDYRIEPAAWDAIVSIFCHLPGAFRARVMRDIAVGLKPGGLLILEGYTPRQLEFASGGPKDTDLLYEPETLRAELAGLEFLHFAELTRPVVEGKLHTGMGAVLQIVARKGNP